MQADPAGIAAFQYHFAFRYSLRVSADEIAYYLAPGRVHRAEQSAHNRARGNAGNLFHTAIPQQNFAVISGRANAHGEIVQSLAIVATQIVQVSGDAGKLSLGLINLALQQGEVLLCVMQFRLVGQAAVDHA